MFLTDTIDKNGFSIIVLKDVSSGTFAGIIPSCGAILHSFSVIKNNEPINVIDQYGSRGDFLNNVATKGFKSCKLSPFACRIKNARYQFEGITYQVKKFLLGENAIHGLVYDATFSITQHTADEESATLVVQYEYRGEDEGYPFHFDCIITYRLEKNNELTLTTVIINRDKSNIPVQDGWHPYFTLGKKIDELELQLNSAEKIVFGDNMIPTGEIIPYKDFMTGKKLGAVFFDDCFKLDFGKPQPLCTLRNPENKIQVEIIPQQNYPWLQLYTPPHRQSIAIENLSAPPDTFNNGIDLNILSPGETLTFSTCYKITTS